MAQKRDSQATEYAPEQRERGSAGDANDPNAGNPDWQIEHQAGRKAHGGPAELRGNALTAEQRPNKGPAKNNTVSHGNRPKIPRGSGQDHE